MSDRSIRNLANLETFGSTSRVLNLLSVWKRHGSTPEWADEPLFNTPGLNRAMVIKHRLRRDEVDLFRSRRQVATKILLPIDDNDLRLGARFIFVGQIQFDKTLREYFGLTIEDRDLKTLSILDGLPSLDPFILREQLKRNEIKVAKCYFELTDADMRRMFSFVESEIRPLVAKSLVGVDLRHSEAATKTLVTKILTNAGGDEMAPLRDTLRLAPDEYSEGIFCWKGFLYYKWSLAGVLSDVATVADEISSKVPVGPMDDESRTYIERGRRVLRGQIIETCRTVRSTIKYYDDAYKNLTSDGQPTAFRDFLLSAPTLFTRLGEQVGAVQHVVSFWRYRFGPRAPSVSVEELIDIFMDFETSMAARQSN